MLAFYFEISVAVVLLIYIIILYNSLVQVKHNVDKAWANIDVILKQRHDEMPKLVELCSQYRDFEQNTLLHIAETRIAAQNARQNQDMTKLSIAESDLQQGLQHFFAIAESYPALQTNQEFLQLQNCIANMEDTLVDRRDLYNESVNVNNMRIGQFPDVIIARLFGFKMRQLLQPTLTEPKGVDIKP